MTAQQAFEELVENEGKLAHFAALSEHGSLPQERAQIVETLITCSEKDRALVEWLLDAFATMPEAYQPIVARFEELQAQMLRREDGWKKVLHNAQGLLTTSAMNAVSQLCMKVDEPLSAIVATLHGLAAASAVEAFLRWAVDVIESSSGSSKP